MPVFMAGDVYTFPSLGTIVAQALIYQTVYFLHVVSVFQFLPSLHTQNYPLQSRPTGYDIFWSQSTYCQLLSLCSSYLPLYSTSEPSLYLQALTVYHVGLGDRVSSWEPCWFSSSLWLHIRASDGWLTCCGYSPIPVTIKRTALVGMWWHWLLKSWHLPQTLESSHTVSSLGRRLCWFGGLLGQSLSSKHSGTSEIPWFLLISMCSL